MERLFLDTNIFLDFYFDRKDSLKPLGEFAFRLIQEAINCKYFVLTSETNIKEICKVTELSLEDVWDRILSDLSKANKIKVIDFSQKQYEEAKEISAKENLPIADCIVAILAKDNNATVVSRDWHHEELLDIVEVTTPEELL